MRPPILLALAFLASSPFVEAQQRPPVASLSELTGCWQKIAFPESAKPLLSQVDIGDARYQVLCFDEDGSTFRILGSTEPINFAVPNDLAELAKLPKVMSYKLVQSGIVIIEHLQAKQVQGWASSFFPTDVNFLGVAVSKGTLVMGLIAQGPPAKIVHWRYLAKIVPAKQ